MSEQKLIVIGASAGGLSAVTRVLGSLPADFPIPIALVLSPSRAVEKLSYCEFDTVVWSRSFRPR